MVTGPRSTSMKRPLFALVQISRKLFAKFTNFANNFAAKLPKMSIDFVVVWNFIYKTTTLKITYRLLKCATIIAHVLEQAVLEFSFNYNALSRHA